jgi:hypothetical protein
MLLHFCTRNRGNWCFNIVRPLALEFGLLRMVRQPSADAHVIWVARHKVTWPQTILKFWPPSSLDPTSCWGMSWPKSSRTLTRLLFLDSPEHVDSENLIKQISFGRSAYHFFSKRDFYFIKCGENWQKLTKNGIFRFFWKSLILYCIRSKNVWDVFHDLKNVKIANRSLKICQFWPILANFSYILWI